MRFAIVAVALTLVVSACGSKSGSQTTTSSAPPDVQAAVTKTLAAGSEHMQIAAHATASGQSVALSGSGDFDQAKRIGKLHASLGIAGIQAAIDEVLTGTTVYVSAPQLFSAFLPAGKTWLSVDLATASKTLGVNGAVLDAQDPSAALGRLKTITDWQQVGTATIGGVQTTHFRGRDATAKRPELRGPFDVWVGTDGYVHRVRVVVTSSAAGRAATTTATITLSKFGEGVIVSVPPASATVDASKLSIPGLSG